MHHRVALLHQERAALHWLLILHRLECRLIASTNLHIHQPIHVALAAVYGHATAVFVVILQLPQGYIQRQIR